MECTVDFNVIVVCDCVTALQGIKHCEKMDLDCTTHY